MTSYTVSFLVFEWIEPGVVVFQHVYTRTLRNPLLSLLSSETLMDSTTATAELGWTVYPVSGTSENSVSLLTHTHTHTHTHTNTQTHHTTVY